MTAGDGLDEISWRQRVFIARRYGRFMDAKHMVYMSQTFGLPIDMYVTFYLTRYPDGKIPFVGLKHELICIGKAESAIDSLFEELRIGFSGLRDA